MCCWGMRMESEEEGRREGGVAAVGPGCGPEGVKRKRRGWRRELVARQARGGSEGLTWQGLCVMSVSAELFYTVGSPELVEARRAMAAFSFAVSESGRQ